MKSLWMLSLIVLSEVPVFATVQADDASVQQALTQLERDWGQASVKNDTAAIDKLMANDWAGIDFEGNSLTKAQIIADMKSGASSTQSYELGTVKVRVLGNIAIVTGSDTEKSQYKGKESSGKYVWTDIWSMHDGHWQAVASQSVKVK